MRLSRPPAQPPGGNLVPALRIGDGPWPAAADRRGSVAQVVVQLMIPPGQLVHLRLPDGQGIQTGMRRRDGLVPQGRGRQAPAHRAAGPAPRPPAGPNSPAGQPPSPANGAAISTIAREPFPRRLLSQRSDQDGRARRMAGHDRTIIQGRQLPPDRRAPPGITRVALSRQARAADLVATAEFPAAGSRPACHPTGRARPRRRPG